MKIVCPQEDLLNRLQIVARGVSQRSTVQILSGILIRAEAGGSIELAATDMELSVRASLRAEVAEPGSTVLTGRLLLEIVRTLPQQPVTLEQAAGSGAVKLTCGSSEYSLHSQGAEDFPHLPEASGPSFAVDRAAFVATINHVARAASKDESRPVLTGVLVEFGDGTVTMAATDSYRLSVKEAALPGSGGDAQAIVPARGALLMKPAKPLPRRPRARPHRGSRIHRRPPLTHNPINHQPTTRRARPSVTVQSHPGPPWRSRS
jgi:DNA polymerase-3 subunit beta